MSKSPVQVHIKIIYQGEREKERKKDIEWMQGSEYFVAVLVHDEILHDCTSEAVKEMSIEYLFMYINIFCWAAWEGYWTYVCVKLFVKLEIIQIWLHVHSSNKFCKWAKKKVKTGIVGFWPSFLWLKAYLLVYMSL